MDEKIYQNIDTPKINPLEPIDNNLSQLVTIKKIPLKFIPLIALGIIIFILSVAALVVTSQRKSDNHNLAPTPTVEIPTSSETLNDSLIPTMFQADFKDIDASLNYSPNLPPPEIDISVGL
jgi:hypothetical protein